jgi:hypothetical protein
MSCGIYDANGNIVGVVISQLNRLKVAKTIGSLPELVNVGIKAPTVRQFLTASGLPTKWSARTNAMSTKDLVKIAQNQTIMVVCGRRLFLTDRMMKRDTEILCGHPLNSIATRASIGILP